jgi:hypothetical protein
LDIVARIAPGADLTADPSTWVFVDLTCPSPVNPAQTISRVLNTPITVKRGIAVGGTNAQTTSATVQCFNLDGALTPQLVTSPYWPYVDAGTPIQVAVRNQDALTDTFTRTASNGWGAGEGITWITTGSSFAVGGTNATWAHATRNVVRTTRTDQTRYDCDVTFDASIPTLATGQNAVIGPILRNVSNHNIWTHLEFMPTGGITVTVRHVSVGATVYTTDAQQVVASLTYSAGTMIRCRTLLEGDRVRVKAWLASGSEPSTWALDVTVVHFGSGLVGMQSWLPSSNTNTLPFTFTVDNFVVVEPYMPRVQGYITDVRPMFIPQPDGSTWSTVMIDIGGVGSRLEKQQSPAESPLRRSVRTATVTPIAYWPLEDAEGSTVAASAFPGGPKMLPTGPVVFSFSQGVPVEQFLSKYGTKPMASVAAGARLAGVVPATAVQNEWAISLVAEFLAPEVTPSLSEMRILQWDTPSGTHNRWALIATPPGYTVRAYNDGAGTTTNVAVFTTGSFVGQLTYTVEGHQNGGNIDVELFANDNSIATGSVAGTQARATRVVVNPDGVNTTASVTPRGLKFVVGHVRVVDEVSVHDTPFYTVPETSQVVSAIYAWYYEPAHRRLKRLCDEERVPFRFLGDPGTTGMTVLNSQQDGAFLDLIKAAAEAESGGLLYEAGFGYEYLPRSARYNQAAGLTIDLDAYKYSDGDAADVLVPQLDSRAANFWTISRTNGSSASFAADLAYRLRRGTINEERTLDVLTDDVLDDHAAWRTHVNVDAQGANYPSIPVDLAANPELLYNWLGCGIGSRVQRLNQPTVAGSGTIDQVIEGITETISPTSWTVTAAATAGTVWDVGVWDDPGTVYSPTATTLSSPLNTTALSLSMNGETWITGAVSLTLEIDGEWMTVSNISGSGPYTVTIAARHVNGLVASHLAGASVRLATPARYAL